MFGPKLGRVAEIARRRTIARRCIKGVSGIALVLGVACQPAAAAGLSAMPTRPLTDPLLGGSAMSPVPSQLTASTSSRRTTLSSAACAGLRVRLHSRSADCSFGESADLIPLGQATTFQVHSRASVVSTSHFYYVDMFVFGSTWSVQGIFYVTNSGSQWWINKVYGTPKCRAGATNVSWCAWVNNGKPDFEVGFNYGHGDWARFDPELFWYSTRAYCFGSPAPFCTMEQKH